MCSVSVETMELFSLGRDGASVLFMNLLERDAEWDVTD